MAFASVLYPLYKRVLQIFKGSSSAASLSVVLLFITVVLVPLVIIGTFVISEASVWMDNIPRYLDNPPAGIKKMFYYTDNYLHLSEESIRRQVVSQVAQIESFIIGFSASVMGNTIKIAAGIIVFLMSMFCFLRDGAAMKGFFDQNGSHA